MMFPTKSTVLRSPWFWKLVCVTVIVSLLFYVMTSDMMEYHAMYMDKVTRPTSKHFICIHLQGTKLEQKLFEFSYGFGIAQSLGSFIIMQRREEMRSVFTLKPVKFLKSTTVCDSFQRISVPNFEEYINNMSLLKKDKHYDLKTNNMTNFPSILYFDRFKHILMQHLQFTKNINANAEGYLKTLVTHAENETESSWTNIAVYVADMRRNGTVPYDDHVNYMIKYLTVAISYYTTRVANARFIVYAMDIHFARKILSKQNVNVIYIVDRFIMEKQPEVLMRVLSLCDHVITSEAVDMFGWWVGYFTKGTVVYPRKFTDDSLDTHGNKDIYPHSWIGLVF